ncbi:winged helix-turn-helix transcriptional regulator [Algiphilus aromaticivorans]|uniref:winged helix-turn-helix transcriptional regulator n=1 Tax=Algiphilus aromaticivorans TaxID=382454 RepID=UPI0005C12FEC|nr:helix-turn-helix domain-containing protein [Algiphilus aromaticivorans]
MATKQPSVAEDSVARTLDIVGDRWSFLILREAFFGVKRFEALQANLGIATNVLSQRLRKLTAAGVFHRAPDPEDGRKRIYRLTEQGRDLYGVCLSLMAWGDRWLADAEGPPLVLTHRNCGAPMQPVVVCSECGEPLQAREVRYRLRDAKAR